MLGNDTPVSVMGDPVSEQQVSIRKIIVREAALLLGLLFVGLVVLPVAIYFVGQLVFGEYGGSGYVHFFSELSGKVRAGDRAAWFLVLSPYLGWQALRLIGLGWRVAGRQPAPRSR